MESPRFQTEHLVESFDNHAMKAGSLLLDSRTPQDVVDALKARGHKVEMAGPGNGSAPVFVRRFPTGVIEAGADPSYFRSSRAW